MAFAFLVSEEAFAASASAAATTAAIDTSGANLIVCKATYNWNGGGGALLSDNKSNSWTPLTEYGQSGTGVTTTRLFYAYAATVGSGHTFSFDFGTNGYVNLQVLAFSGAMASPFDQENGNNGSSVDGSVTCGAVFPSANNELIVAGAGVLWGSATDIDSVNNGFTLQEVSAYHTNQNYGGAIAYKIKTNSNSDDATFSWSGGGAFISCAAIATFYSSSGNPWNYYAQQ